MPDNVRTAHYTSASADEVHLRYVPQDGPGAGKPADVFYSAEDYQRRQFHHGRDTYPDPKPAR